MKTPSRPVTGGGMRDIFWEHLGPCVSGSKLILVFGYNG